MEWYYIVAGICMAMVSTSTCQKTDCGDVMCAMYCEFGFKERDGCPICECNTQTEIKDGGCPSVDPDVVSLCVEQCAHDGNCTGEQKCCFDGCGHQCRAPVRLGYCPDVIQCGGSNPACTADSDCDNSTFKCCSNECSDSVCVPPAEEKRGTCPIGSLPEGSSGICSEECSRDADCPALQKCCSNGCGHVCVIPADLPVIHAGSCPAVEEGSVGICAALCENDGVCADDKKCCPNSCNGYSCVKAEIKPACDEFSCLMWCPYGFQIDNNGCKICACQTPTEIHAGECPVVPSGTLGSCVNLCSHDGECAETQKCCSNGCGRACVDSVVIPDQCPPVAPDMVGACRETCGDSCPGSQLCCSNGCGHQCTDPIQVHDGECPTGELAFNVIGACVEMCQYDGECASNQKCCSNGCGHACTTVTNTQPANCPDVTCLRFCDYGNKKDSNGCDICECQDPIEAGVERPGECPVGFLPEGIVGTCAEECSRDIDCPNTAQKCCSNGCGHVCVDALNVGPQCPPVCKRYCEFGNVKDENGCDTCQCNSERVCDPVICQLHCPYGNKEDENGCPICQCEDKPEGCPNVMCAMFCPHGLQRDSEGCEVCQCTTEELASFSAQGSCPAPSADYAGSCADLCDIDSECKEGEKCCFNGCGYTCVESSGAAATILSSPIMAVVLSTLLSVLAICKL